MAKSRTYRVLQGRAHFKCPNCQATRLYTIPPGVRQRTIRCGKCGEMTRCTFNRRLSRREQQLGKVNIILNDGNRLEANLADISFGGVGFDVMFRDVRKIKTGSVIRFHCSWNSRLFGSENYIIRSIKGQRIGAQRLNKNGSL